RPRRLVNLVPPLAAVLAALALVVLPGLTVLALLPEREREALEGDEALYLTIAGSVLAASSVGLLLAGLGRFSLLSAGVWLAAPAWGSAGVPRGRGARAPWGLCRAPWCWRLRSSCRPARANTSWADALPGRTWPPWASSGAPAASSTPIPAWSRSQRRTRRCS